MTTLIIITLTFLSLMVIVFAILILFCTSLAKKNEVSKETTLLGMISVLGLIWSIVSLITFYNILP